MRCCRNCAVRSRIAARRHGFCAALKPWTSPASARPQRLLTARMPGYAPPPSSAQLAMRPSLRATCRPASFPELAMVRRLVLAFLFLMAAALSAHAAGKDSVVIALRLEPPSLDPTTQAAAAVSELTWQTIFEGLTRVNEAGQVQPSLAEGWESEDAKTYTFKLRQGVTFHDGAPFTSADVKFTFERNAAANSTNKRKQVFANMAAIET